MKSKYTVSYINNINPQEVILNCILPDKVNKYTKLKFIDLIYGEFECAVRNVDINKGSVHPERLRQKVIAGLAKSEKRKTKGQRTRATRIANGSYAKTSEAISKQKSTWDSKRVYTYTTEKINKMLPDNVTIVPGIDYLTFNVEHSYSFNDPVHGLFATSLRGLLDAGYSTHPAHAAKRRNATLSKIKKGGHTKPELEIKEYLDSLNVKVDKTYLGPTAKEIDLYSEEHKLGIEYNESYYHNDGLPKIDKHYHKNKTVLANKHGIDLMQFTNFEWNDRQAQVKSFLKSKFGKNQTIISARKCKLKVIDKPTAKAFLDTFHILGRCGFTIAYGLYNDDKLVSLITLAPHHRKGGKELVLNRYIVASDVTVSGGLSKLCSHAFKLHGVFYTFVDLRWSKGNNWIKSGWILVDTLDSDFFYYLVKRGSKHSKQEMKKFSDYECGLMGYKKVWDCGKLKLKYTK